MNVLYEVREACYLRAYMPDNMEFVSSIADIFGCRPLKSDSENFYHFLETVYNYGIIQGVRKERRSRKRAVKAEARRGQAD